MEPLYGIKEVKPEEYEAIRKENEKSIIEAKERFNDYWRPKVQLIPSTIRYSPSRNTIGIFIGDMNEDSLSEAEENLARNIRCVLTERLASLRVSNIDDWIE